jgi:hypothetical protein
LNRNGAFTKDEPSRTNDAAPVPAENLPGASRTRAADKTASLSNQIRSVKLADRVLTLLSF